MSEADLAAMDEAVCCAKAVLDEARKAFRTACPHKRVAELDERVEYCRRCKAVRWVGGHWEVDK